MLFSIGGIIFALLQIPADYIADRIGRKIVIVISYIAMSIAYISYANAKDVLDLYIFFSIEALGSALLNPTLAVIIADYIVDTYRGRIYGFKDAIARLISIPAPMIEAGYGAHYLLNQYCTK